MSWQPEILDPEHPQDLVRLQQLFDSGVGRVDTIHPQLEAWRALDEEPSTPPTRWIYYPWRNCVAHILGPESFWKVRLDRNRHQITREEQRRLRTRTVGVVGLSVGHAIAHTIALEGLVGTLRLADFDDLELSNLNRVPATVLDLGLNKAVVCARRLLEVDPYINLEIHERGLHDDNAQPFMTGLDLLIEECDSLDWKVRLRELAREHRVPTLMATSDGGLLDIERFDLDPERPLFHGLLGDIDASPLRDLSSEDNVPFALSMLGGDRISPKLAASLIEIGQTIETWPQLGSAVTLGAAQVAHATRRIGLGQDLPSGRVRLDPATHPPQEPPRVAAEDFSQTTAATTEGAPNSLASAAAMAPSAANAQPWRFTSEENSFTVALDPGRTVGSLDIDARASIVAVGCAVECARIQALANGQRGTLDWIERPTFSGRLAFTPTSADGALAAQLRHRRTDRRHGDGRSIDPGDLKQIEAASNGHVSIITRREQLTRIGQLLGASDRLRFLHPQLHEELTSELRWSPSCDGLELHTLGMTPGDLAKLNVMRRPEVVSLVRSWGGGRALETSASKLIENTAAMAVVSTSGNDSIAYAEAGRSVVQAWLAAQQLGVCVQPVAPITAYAQSDDELASIFDGEELARACNLRRAFQDAFALGQRTLVLPMRLFRQEGLVPRSARRPLHGPEGTLDHG